MCHFSKAFPTPALHCGPPRPGCRRSEESGAGFVGRRVVAGAVGGLKHLVRCRALQDSSQDGLFTIQRASQPSQGRVHPRSCVGFTLLRKQNIGCFCLKRSPCSSGHAGRNVGKVSPWTSEKRGTWESLSWAPAEGEPTGRIRVAALTVAALRRVFLCHDFTFRAGVKS